MPRRPLPVVSTLALLIGAGLGLVLPRPAGADVKAEVDKIFSRFTAETPGCAVGADVKGQPAIRAAYGMADLEHDVANTAETIFETGSVAKQFTAAAVLLLARDGKLSLDDPIRKHIPEVPESAAAVTIRQMLQHTGGLRDWGTLAGIAGWPRGTRVHTHEHALDIISRQKALNFTPGTRWSYSNTGYNLAAVLVSRVSGMSFAAFTKARIFEPLGMRDSSWRDDYTRVVKRRAIGYNPRAGGYATNMPFENVHGNGGMLTTVADLLKWNANLDAAAPVVGDAAFFGELQRPARFTDGRAHEYALGLYVDTFRGVREVDHSGGTAGYVTHLIRYPEQQVSVAVLCNTTNASPTAYAKAVARLFLTGLADEVPPKATHTLTAEESGRLVGLYRMLDPVFVMTVQQDEDGLSVKDVSRLFARSPTSFLSSDGSTAEFEGGGRLTVTDEYGRVMRFHRVEPVTMTAAAAAEFAGRYDNDEVETTLMVAWDGNRVVVRRRAGSITPLTAVSPDTFSSPLGWVVFRRDASGRVTGLSISQDRVWDLAFVRQQERSTQ
jgi:CubicO group peptidase (beta-lactamase class C family)